jgi:micrococcal nuclease
MIIVPDGRCAGASDVAIRVQVQRVFDGDGFLGNAWNSDRRAWVNRIPFRLAFIDAPEMDQPFGRESRDFLDGLVAGRSLDLAPVLKGSIAPTFIDPYKRVLCVPFLTEVIQPGRVDYYWQGCCASGSVRSARSVTRNIELEMVVNGWAWVVERYTFDCEAEYLAAQDDARQSRRGLWVDDNPEPPWNFKRRQNRRDGKLTRQGRLL